MRYLLILQLILLATECSALEGLKFEQRSVIADLASGFRRGTISPSRVSRVASSVSGEAWRLGVGWNTDAVKPFDRMPRLLDAELHPVIGKDGVAYLVPAVSYGGLPGDEVRTAVASLVSKDGRALRQSVSTEMTGSVEDAFSVIEWHEDTEYLVVTLHRNDEAPLAVTPTLPDDARHMFKVAADKGWVVFPASTETMTMMADVIRDELQDDLSSSPWPSPLKLSQRD